jgi:hypothetical protein
MRNILIFCLGEVFLKNIRSSGLNARDAAMWAFGFFEVKICG